MALFDLWFWRFPMRSFVRVSHVALALGLACSVSSSFSHVVLADQAALAGTSYRATLRVGHGCDGSPVTALRVSIPNGFTGAKPMPKAGWTLTTKVGKLSKPYDDHGKQVSEGLLEVIWTAASKDSWLQDAWYDEFVLRGSLPKEAGPMWFKVLQTCEKGSIDWAETPASGNSTKGLKFPAALLELIESGAAAHQH
jgi:periplasmic copper chaperone A